MKVLDKAIKIYWRSRGFNKIPNSGYQQMELDAFSEGWKAALEWVLKDLYTPLSPTAAKTIRKELNGTS